MAKHSITESGALAVVRRGDVLELCLRENASTGFRWEVQSMPPGVHLVDSELAVPPPMAPGKGGERVMSFEVDDPTPGELRLALRRSWEATEPPAETFTVRIEPA
jgi:predicted secreted protein